MYTASTLEPAIRKVASYREEVRREGGREASGGPLIKVAVAAVIANPTPDRYQEGVLENEEAGASLCKLLVDVARGLCGGAEIESFGKGAIVGTAGDQEQALGFLASGFGDALRDATGGTEWVSSVTKRGGPGAQIDIPLAHKRVIKARSHYDAVTISVADAPGPDEIMIVLGVATGPRVNERAKGVTVADGNGEP